LESSQSFFTQILAMNMFQVALAFHTLLSIRGFRIGARKPQEAATNPNEYPASPSCLLASGFDMQRGCQYPEAFHPVPNCDNAAFDQACYAIDRAETVQGYMRDVRSASDYSSLTRSVTEAEAGGFGVSISSSFSYIKTSQVSEKSLAFFIGASGRTQTRTIQRPVDMRLTAPAKALLQQDPEGFINRHGLKYIHAMTYGGSFLGSVTMNSRETADSRDTEAMASFSVTSGFFSASGSTEFQNKVRQENLNISIFINSKWTGGSDINANFSNPETLSNMFQEWDRSWRAHPAPLTVSTRRWIDSAEVQEIVNSMSAEHQALFDSPDISFAIRREITDENARVALTDTSVRRALAWRETQQMPAVRSCLTAVSREVSGKLMKIEGLNDAKLLIIQGQWLSGNYSWFQASSFQDRYLSCVETVEIPMVEIPGGRGFIKLGPWRIGEWDNNHFVWSHESGNTAWIMTSSGNNHQGPRTDFNLGGRSLLAKSDVVVGDGFLEFNGRWRLGDADGGHFSLQYVTGTVAMIWRSDGTHHMGPRRGFGTWHKSRTPCGRVSFETNSVQVGSWRMGNVDWYHMSIYQTSTLKTAVIYRNDGTAHPGPRDDIQQRAATTPVDC